MAVSYAAPSKDALRLLRHLTDGSARPPTFSRCTRSYVTSVRWRSLNFGASSLPARSPSRARLLHRCLSKIDRGLENPQARAQSSAAAIHDNADEYLAPVNEGRKFDAAAELRHEKGSFQMHRHCTSREERLQSIAGKSLVNSKANELDLHLEDNIEPEVISASNLRTRIRAARRARARDREFAKLVFRGQLFRGDAGSRENFQDSNYDNPAKAPLENEGLKDGNTKSTPKKSHDDKTPQEPCPCCKKTHAGGASECWSEHPDKNPFKKLDTKIGATVLLKGVEVDSDTDESYQFIAKRFIGASALEDTTVARNMLHNSQSVVNSKADKLDLQSVVEKTRELPMSKYQSESAFSKPINRRDSIAYRRMIIQSRDPCTSPHHQQESNVRWRSIPVLGHDTPPDDSQVKPTDQARKYVSKAQNLATPSSKFEQYLFKKDYALAAKLLLKQSLQLANAGDVSDWDSLRRLYAVEAPKIPMKHRTQYQQPLINSLLHKIHPSPGVAWQLADMHYIKFESEESPLARYLRDFCRKEKSLAQKWLVTHNVLQRLQQALRQADVDLVLPFLHSAIVANRIYEAYKLISDTCSELAVSPTRKILYQFVLAFSRLPWEKQDWSRIDDLLLASYELGYSHTEPAWHARLVLRAVQGYALHMRPKHVYDYVAYHMHTSGLIPNWEFSRWMFRYYILHGAMRLALMWARLVYDRFPDVSRPFVDHKLNQCVSVDESLSHTMAVCRILAYGTVRSPFDEDFSLFLTSTVVNRIIVLAQVARYQGFSPEFMSGQLLDPRCLLNEISHWLLTVRQQYSSAVSRSLTQISLHREVHSARDILTMLVDYRKHQTEFPWWETSIEDVTSVATAKPHIWKQIPGSLTAIFEPTAMPPADVLPGQRHQTPETWLSMVTKVGMQKRVSGLVLNTEPSGSPQVVFAGLQAASDISDSRSVRAAVWQLTDASSHDCHRLLQILFYTRDHVAVTLSTQALEETQYLQRRVFRCLWSTWGYPDLSQFPHSGIQAMYKEEQEFHRNLQSRIRHDRNAKPVRWREVASRLPARWVPTLSTRYVPDPLMRHYSSMQVQYRLYG